MKRVLLVFVLLVAGLTTLLVLRLQEQRLRATGASGGSGTLEGTKVDIIARLPSRVAGLSVGEGDSVEPGQVLVTLDCSEPEAAVRQAEATIAAARAGVAAAQIGIALAEHGATVVEEQVNATRSQARATRAQGKPLKVKQDAAKRATERLEKIKASGSASEQDLDKASSEAAALAQQIDAIGAAASAVSAQADVVAEGKGTAELQEALARAQVTAAEKQVAVAEAARDRAAVMVEECTLEAPLHAEVDARHVELGEAVLPGTRLLTLIDARELRATFYLPNQELDAAKPGREVTVVPDALSDRTWRGVIRRVGAEAEFTPRNVQTRDDRDRLVYAVEVAIANEDGALRPGMPVEITIPGTERE